MTQRREPTTAGYSWVALLASLVIFRLVVGFDPFPWWSGDPTIMPAPLVSLTPVWSLVTDGLTLLAAAGVVFSLAHQRRTVGITTATLFGCGLAAATYHSMADRINALDTLIYASHWTASLAAGIACFAAGREPKLRGLLAGAVFGVIAMLAAKGAMQVFVEHPMTVQMFAEQKAALFEAQGWSPGSPMALAYERRLMQAEATGWLGMSNVMGTMAAASFVAFVGMLLGVWPHRAKARGAVAVLACATVISAIALALTKSKGGMVACGSGVVLLVIAALWSRRQSVLALGRWSLLIGPLIVLSPLVAVIVRGQVGERIGELSLFFRWFYMQAAVRIIGEHPVTGVGPTGFKEAYLLAKNPLSPEEVSLPHSVMLDWISTLGLGGWAWAMLLLWLASRIGRAVFVAPPPSVEDVVPLDRVHVRKVAFLVFAGATLAAAFIERPLASIDVMAVRIFGMLAGTFITVQVARIVADFATTRLTVIALGAAAFAALLHAQIELTGTHMGAAPWFMAVVGLAAGAWIPGHAPPLAAVAARQFLILGALAAIGIVVGIAKVGPWEASLGKAAAQVEDLPTFSTRYSVLRNGKPSDGDSWQSLATDLGLLTGKAVSTHPDAVGSALQVWSVNSLAAASQYLEGASRASPSHLPTLRSLTKLQSQRASTTGDAVLGSRAVDMADDFASHYPSAQSLGWLALINRSLAEMLQQPERITAAEASLLRACVLAPYELPYVVQLAEVRQKMGKRAEAGESARKALELDAITRLDPLKSLSPAERERMKKLAEGG